MLRYLGKQYSKFTSLCSTFPNRMGKLEKDEEMYLSILKARALCGLKQADLALEVLREIPQGMLRKIYFHNSELQCLIDTPEYKELIGS